ncbi:FAD-dependent monooxygenase [Corynebacterium glyciniphilum]|uniref:FAD-dependent monooxygenase n=1 Tax=Corynebacterium glyciniphilum TaxID=1404244 RepID=UPI0011AB5598|nr:FAD-dependent monooxygenase [Corynebacterium glyciniphilum]
MKTAIAGGGVGGLALALGLIQRGMDVAVYEQAPEFGQVGADVNLTPNSTRALDGLHAEVGATLRTTGARPRRRLSRRWDSGEVTSDLPMGDSAEERYGAPQLTVHRASLLDALRTLLPDDVLHLGHRLDHVENLDDCVRLHFSSGQPPVEADILVGADGIHSVVRDSLFGEQDAEYTGLVAYRTVVPGSRLPGVPNLDSFTKWWGPDSERQLVTFPLNRGQDLFVFATAGEEEWTAESWTTTANATEFREQYADFHPEVAEILGACDQVMKSALRVRDPMPRWSDNRVTLLGDACHPMTPFMAQGAGQAIEDAVVLCRALTEGGDMPVPACLRVYEEARHERTARIQLTSRANDWLKSGDEADWLYDYDAWHVPLALLVTERSDQ